MVKLGDALLCVFGEKRGKVTIVAIFRTPSFALSLARNGTIPARKKVYID